MRIEALIARAHEMKRLIDASLGCGCLTLEECALHVRVPVPDTTRSGATNTGDATGAGVLGSAN